MILRELVNDVISRVDDFPDTIDVVRWMQAGLNRLGQAVEAKFPELIDSNGNYEIDSEPPIDPLYHEALVLFASARFKEQDGSVREAENFMFQWEDMKKGFVANYQVPPQYRNDRLSEQFIATEGQTDFTITKNGYDPRFGDLVVYVNGKLSNKWRTDTISKKFSLGAGAKEGDLITAVWEEHTDLVEPPYSWWGW